MRTSRTPKEDLSQTITTLAMTMEALKEGSPLRRAGQHILNHARDAMLTVPDELPPALNTADKASLKKWGCWLDDVARQLETIWKIKNAKAKHAPAWLRRRRDQTEADFFDAFLQQLDKLDYEPRHTLLEKIPRAEIEKVYQSWYALHLHGLTRQRHLPALRRASACVNTLRGLQSVIELEEMS